MGTYLAFDCGDHFAQMICQDVAFGDVRSWIEEFVLVGKLDVYAKYISILAFVLK